ISDKLDAKTGYRFTKSLDSSILTSLIGFLTPSIWIPSCVLNNSPPFSYNPFISRSLYPVLESRTLELFKKLRKFKILPQYLELVPLLLFPFIWLIKWLRGSKDMVQW